jgi:uncharacterized protein YbcI
LDVFAGRRTRRQAERTSKEESVVASHPGSPPDDRPAGGQLGAAISNAVVHIQREHLGRGPTKARTSILEDTIVVLMQDTLTKAERSLVADGKGDEVLLIRQSLQHTMEAELIDTVQRLTRRSVAAFMSAHHVDPDLACEIFVLEPEEPGRE